MIVLSCTSTVCRTFEVPAPSATLASSNIVVTLVPPPNLAVSSSTPSHGSLLNNVWTIPTLPANTNATIEVCFAILDCGIPAPDSKSGSVSVTSGIEETDYTNNTAVFDIDYITCGEVSKCLSPIQRVETLNVTGGSVAAEGLLPDSNIVLVSKAGLIQNEGTYTAGTDILTVDPVASGEDFVILFN